MGHSWSLLWKPLLGCYGDKSLIGCTLSVVLPVPGPSAESEPSLGFSCHFRVDGTALAAFSQTVLCVPGLLH